MFPHFSKRLHTFPKRALLINRNYTLLLNAINLLHIGAGVLIFVGGLHASRQFRKLQERTHMDRKAGQHSGTL